MVDQGEDHYNNNSSNIGAVLEPVAKPIYLYIIPREDINTPREHQEEYNLKQG